MVTGPVRMPAGTMVLINPNGANTILEGQGVPSTVIQPPGKVQYVGLQLGSPSNQPLQSPQMLEKLRKRETKTLGAIQIMMGLIHIGFGCVSVFVSLWPSAATGVYPFWGGAFFIISGSLSVSAENRSKICLVKCSVGFNILSAITALAGIILYLIQFTEAPQHEADEDFHHIHGVSIGFCVVLLLFSMLEFCITVSTAHFGLKTISCHNEPAPVFIPRTVSGGPVVPVEGSFAPPTYNTIVSSLK